VAILSRTKARLDAWAVEVSLASRVLRGNQLNERRSAGCKRTQGTVGVRRSGARSSALAGVWL
jgi:hypothetical protein